MIKEYSTGQELLNDNQDFLQTNPDLACFFYWDGPLIKQTDQQHFVLKAQEDDKQLLAMSIPPYPLLLFGHPQLAFPLVDYLVENGYRMENVLCEIEVGRQLIQATSQYQIAYELALGMDFMETREITEPSCSLVSIPEAEDVAEICELMECFVRDCGLQDPVNPEKTRKELANFRIIRLDGRIISMAKIQQSSQTAYKISAVYTRDAYRGQSWARKVVNTCKNEIIQLGYIATLNVDQKNPITNHLYRSLGFKERFSQGEFRRIDQ